MTTTKERRRKEKRYKKEETKDKEYLITYTRHLEERLRNLEAVNLRLKQELNNLRNEKDK